MEYPNKLFFVCLRQTEEYNSYDLIISRLHQNMEMYMTANETTIHQSLNEVNVSNYRQPYDRQK